MVFEVLKGGGEVVRVRGVKAHVTEGGDLLIFGVGHPQINAAFAADGWAEVHHVDASGLRVHVTP